MVLNASNKVGLCLKFFEFLIEKLSGPSPSKPVKSMDSSGIILVAGATGGVGRRVVDILRSKGLSVRALVFTCNPLPFLIANLSKRF